MDDASYQELDAAADRIDWDEDLFSVYEIIRSPNCDLGTALKLYWRAGAQWFTQYSQESEIPSLHKDDWSLCKEIEQRVTSGFYSSSHVVFDARDDDGSDHTADYLSNPIRRPIPHQIFAPFPAPEPFSSDLLERAVKHASTVPSAKRFSAAMTYLKRRIQSGENLRDVVNLLQERLSQQ